MATIPGFFCYVENYLRTQKLCVCNYVGGSDRYWCYELGDDTLHQLPRDEFWLPRPEFHHVFFGRKVDMEFEREPFLVFEKKTGSLLLAPCQLYGNGYDEFICLHSKEETVKPWETVFLGMEEVEPAPSNFKFQIFQNSNPPC